VTQSFTHRSSSSLEHTPQDTIGNITVHDPWDYDDNPPIGNYSYEYFIQLWNYTEHNSPRKNPFMGAAIYPWDIDITATELYDTTTVNISANVAYPCYSPFDCTQFPASNVLISIQLPDVRFSLFCFPIVG
jgi:hypothetical protein